MTTEKIIYLLPSALTAAEDTEIILRNSILKIKRRETAVFIFAEMSADCGKSRRIIKHHGRNDTGAFPTGAGFKDSCTYRKF